MRNQTPKLLTPSYEYQHQTMESSKLSRASMTSQQRKMYESGMFFPEKVIYTAKIDVKSNNEQWEENYPIKLTSQAFGFIPISNINKIKYYRNNQSDKLILKIIAANQQTFFHIQKLDVQKIFSMIAWGKLATMNIFSDMDEECDDSIKGSIYKKSYLFGSWQKKYVTISKQKGLQLAKDAQSSSSHQITSTNQIWTRFQMIKDQSYLIIKLWRGIVKEEYAVPAENAVKWVQAFCTLLTDKK